MDLQAFRLVRVVVLKCRITFEYSHLCFKVLTRGGKCRTSVSADTEPFREGANWKHSALWSLWATYADKYER